MTEIINKHHPDLSPHLQRVLPETSKKEIEGALVLAPPSSLRSPWINRFQPYRIGYASGWMTLRGIRHRYGADKGFVLSDHADWNDLHNAIKETSAHRIIVTHGFADVFSRWLQENGYDAHPAKTMYGTEEEDFE